MADPLRDDLRRAGRWDDGPRRGRDWSGWAAFGGVALLWLVLALVAPELLAALGELFRWGG